MKFLALVLSSLLLVACGGGDESALSPASAHKNATATLVEPQSGWWWNPAESGTGFSIERQGNQIFMAAYLYETNGLATWYVSGLTRQSSGAYSGAMQRYSGGQTLLGTYKAPASTTSVVANALLSFNTASTGSLTITFADGSPNRTITLERFAFAAFAPSNGSFDNGWWWNEAESGRGYFIEAQGSVAFIGSYMFDNTGQPTWYVSGAALQGSQTLSGALDQYTSGQSLGGSYKPPTKVASTGTMAFNFTSRTTANMILPNGSTVALKRFIFSALPTTNIAPSANAGFAQNVVVGSVATLDGSASTDLNADPLTYNWTLTSKPAGSAATLASPTSVNPTFFADVTGTYVASLIVNDGKVNSVSSVVNMTAVYVLPPVTVGPVTGGVFSTGGFMVTVANNSIPLSANAAPVATAVSAVPADVKVSSYETNITSGAKAFTLKIGGTGFSTATVGSVRLEVPFDRNLVPDKTKIDSLHLLLRILNADDNSVVTLTGQIVGDKIVADLTGFPSSATVTVLFNPNMDVAVNDTSVTLAAKLSAKLAVLTNPTWETRNWGVIYDTVEVSPEVQKFLGLNSTPTPPQIRLALKQQIADNAADAAAIYQGEGFRSPKLYVAKTAAEPGGITFGTNPRFLLYYQKKQSAHLTPNDPHEIITADGNHYGRVFIQDTDLNEMYATVGMSIYGTIAHELFHAVQSGYNFFGGALGGVPLKGVIEGTATAYGDFLDRRHNGNPAATPQVRQYPLNSATQIKAETFKLENYLLVPVGVEAYSNQDFFVYLARTLGNNNYKYLANLFEQIQLTVEDVNLSRETVLKGFDAFLSGTPNTTLVKVYGDFVQQRAIEHNDASLFSRPGETVSGLAKELFNNYGVITLKEVQIDPTATSPTTVNDLYPVDTLSARVIRISPMAGKTKGDVVISIAPTKGTFGTTLSGWIYRRQSSASARTATPLLASNKITGFGTDITDEVVIILINPSFSTGGVGVTSEILKADTRFIDKGNGTIYDTVSRLTWLKNANCFGPLYWDDAKAKSLSLASGQCGLTDGSRAGDWHLPTKNELQIFVDDGYRDNSLKAVGFLNVGWTYWSSSADPDFRSGDFMWAVNMNDAFKGVCQKSICDLDIWPVR